MTILRIGTRASALARIQADIVADLVRSRLGVEVELVPIVSDGDRSREPLTEIGGTGVFVGAVRRALATGDCDLAVHSLKDLPTVDDPDVTLAAVPARGDARDALVARDGLTLGELPAGATVGTGSPRRAAQLLALGLGVEVVPIRGNVDTRLQQVADGKVDAVLLARAGLVRLGRDHEITEVIDPIQMLPAPGQGALAVETAATATTLADDVRGALDDWATRASCAAERSLLRVLEAGCSSPIGALGDIAEGDDGPELWLRGVVAAIDGSHLVRLSIAGSPDAPEGVGAQLAADLIAEGADTLVSQVAS